MVLATTSQLVRLSRHSVVNYLIKRALSSAEVPCRLEPSLLAHDDKRPLTPCSNGLYLVWDFACRHTLASSHLNMAVSGVGIVTSEAKNRKSSKYSVLSATYCFTPMVIETMGALGDEAFNSVHQLSRRITMVTGERCDTQVSTAASQCCCPAC